MTLEEDGFDGQNDPDRVTGGISADRLRSIIERVERLEE